MPSLAASARQQGLPGLLLWKIGLLHGRPAGLARYRIRRAQRQGGNTQGSGLQVFIALLLTCPFSKAAEPPARPQPSPTVYEFRHDHDVDGIGKFYLGREIAAVMGHQAADWLERPERDAEEHTEELVRELAIKTGYVIADIGAGTGYFSRRLAARTGPTGKVLAVDIQPEMLEQLTNRAAQFGLTNIVPVLGTTTDPKLPAGTVDLVLMVDVYHEFDFPHEMLEGICRALKPQGRVVFVEYRGEDPDVPIKPLHKMTEAQVKKETAGFPLVWVQTSEVLPRQHIIVFRNSQTGQGAR